MINFDVVFVCHLAHAVNNDNINGSLVTEKKVSKTSPRMLAQKRLSLAHLMLLSFMQLRLWCWCLV